MSTKVSAAQDRARIELLRFALRWSLRTTVLVGLLFCFARDLGWPVGRPLFLATLLCLAWALFLVALSKLLHRWKWTSVCACEDETKQSSAQDYVPAPKPLPPISEAPDPAPASAPIFAASAALSTDANVILVPAEVVARSRPSRHSVPLIAEKYERERPHPFRNLAVMLLIGLVPLLILVCASAISTRWN